MKHDTFAHIEAGGLGVYAKDCPACRVTEWGVCFNDGSVMHPWNGRTARQRAEEELRRLRSLYAPDRFALVSRQGRDAPWVEYWSGAGCSRTLGKVTPAPCGDDPSG